MSLIQPQSEAFLRRRRVPTLQGWSLDISPFSRCNKYPHHRRHPSGDQLAYTSEREPLRSPSRCTGAARFRSIFCVETSSTDRYPPSQVASDTAKEKILTEWNKLATPKRCEAYRRYSYSAMIVMKIFRRCGARRCSKRKMPCHVPSCIFTSAIGTVSPVRVKTMRMCDGMSSLPSEPCVK